MIYCFKRNVNFHLAAGEGTPAEAAVSSEVSGDCSCKGAATVQTIWAHLLHPPPPLFRWVVCVAKFALAGRLTGAVVSFETNRWREELAYFLLWAAVSREEE